MTQTIVDSAPQRPGETDKLCWAQELVGEGVSWKRISSLFPYRYPSRNNTLSLGSPGLLMLPS